MQGETLKQGHTFIGLQTTSAIADSFRILHTHSLI